MRKVVTGAIIFAIMISTALTPFALADGDFTATLMGQLDTDVNDFVDEWGIADIPDATVDFSIGEEATITIEFSTPVKFTGNLAEIITNLPVTGIIEAESTNAHIISFIVDGEELGPRPVTLTDRDDLGYLSIEIARRWGADFDEYDLAGMEPFLSIEITFIVPHSADGGEYDVPGNETEELPDEDYPYDESDMPEDNGAQDESELQEEPESSPPPLTADPEHENNEHESGEGPAWWLIIIISIGGIAVIFFVTVAVIVSSKKGKRQIKRGKRQIKKNKKQI